MYKRKKASTLHQSEKEDDQEPKIMEQHKVVCGTLNTNKDLNKTTIVFNLPDGIRVSNEAWNGSGSGSGNYFVGKLGISAVKSKNKDGNEITQSFYHIKYSLLVKGSEEAIDSANVNKESEELANLLKGTMNIEEDD
jgi:hypothetical protein